MIIIQRKLKEKSRRGRLGHLYIKRITLDIRKESYRELNNFALYREELKSISSFYKSTYSIYMYIYAFSNIFKNILTDQCFKIM